MDRFAARSMRKVCGRHTISVSLPAREGRMTEDTVPFELAVRECQQIMGAVGYTRGGPGERIERISRDVRVLCIGGGSDEILSEMCLMQESKDLQRIMASSQK